MLRVQNFERVLTPAWSFLLLLLAISSYALFLVFYRIFVSPLSKIPGPVLARISNLYMMSIEWRGERMQTLMRLHETYGPVVQVGPREVSFSSLSALRTIYGAGSPFERTPFYKPFDVYGRPNLFTFGPSSEHRARKKLLSHIYANQNILSPATLPMIEEKTLQYLNLLEKANGKPTEIFSSLHFFSIDAISAFVYGPDHGGTTALLGTSAHVALLSDILSPDRRKLAWFSVHLPGFTEWAYGQTGILASVLHALGAIPMAAPTTYTAIREHALSACTSYLSKSHIHATSSSPTVMERLRAYQLSNPGEMSDLDIASECADHLLAGIDTTADTLLFLIWTLSLPQHRHIQERLRAELSTHASSDNKTVPAVKSASSLPFLYAIIKETLRLFAPIPATEPRLCRSNTVVDGFDIKAYTVVGIAPYVLHRDEDVYNSPLSFDPARWLDANGKELGVGELANKHFWAFSSGARMCIGSNLATAEMITLVAAMYTRYKTSVREGEEDVSPGVTSRFEVIRDETKEKMMEHECWIRFEKIV